MLSCLPPHVSSAHQYFFKSGCETCEEGKRGKNSQSCKLRNPWFHWIQIRNQGMLSVLHLSLPHSLCKAETPRAEKHNKNKWLIMVSFLRLYICFQLKFNCVCLGSCGGGPVGKAGCFWKAMVGKKLHDHVVVWFPHSNESNPSTTGLRRVSWKTLNCLFFL